MANTLRLEIVTPEARTFSDDVDLVVIPSSNGELGIFPNHAALITDVHTGELRILKNGVETALAVGEGFAEVTATHVSVLTDMAVAEGDISEEEVKAAIARAEDALKNADKLGAEEVATVEAALQRSLAKLRVKRRHHR